MGTNAGDERDQRDLELDGMIETLTYETRARERQWAGTLARWREEIC